MCEGCKEPLFSPFFLPISSLSFAMRNAFVALVLMMAAAVLVEGKGGKVYNFVFSVVGLKVNTKSFASSLRKSVRFGALVNAVVG